MKDFVTGESSLIALAGPANRQGRIAADVTAGNATRILLQHGFKARNLSGGFLSRAIQSPPPTSHPALHE